VSDAPPQNLEAEEHVLGAMMMSWKAIEAAAEVVKPEDFYRPSNGNIFSAALELHAEGKSVDAITLSDELEKRGHLSAAGGSPKIHELVHLTPTFSNARHYAKIVAEHAGLRRLQGAGQRIQWLVEKREGSLDDLTELAEKALTEALSSSQVTEFRAVANTVDDVADDIEQAYESGESRFGLKTGYTDLDTMLSGLHPGTLTLIAARPAMGKSALALNICENVAYKGTPAGIVSLEMSEAELVIRQLSRAAKLDSQALRTAQMDEEEYERFRKGRVLVKQRTNLYVDDSPGVTPGSLRASVRRLHRQGGLGLLVVDYLQLMLSAKNEDSRQQEIAAISRSLKLLARELHIPIIALSQLNRNLESRPDKRPRLSDLRDSGALEQDADTVLFIYRDEYYEPDSPDLGIAELIVAKNRMGPSGTIRLGFTTRYSTFNNLPKGDTQ
jgi:replicative DNA helicase